MPSNAAAVSMVWFRKGLRLHDNRALLEAIRNASFLIPLVVIDPFLVNPTRCGARPLQFFLECLQDLDRSLREKNSRLVVLTGDPFDIIPRYAQKWNVSKIFCETDTGRYGTVRDANVATALAARSIQLVSYSGHTLYLSHDVRLAYGNRYPQRYEEFRQRVANIVIDDPRPSPEVLPPLPSVLPDSDACIPTLKGLGFDEELKPTALVGGETYALERLVKVMADEDNIRMYSKQDTSPLDFEPASGTWSVAIHCPRLSLSREHTEPPRSLLGQLLWREFHYAASYLTPNIYEMDGNPMCKPIEWRKEPEELFQAWTDERTGYPFIDAAMIQLKQEGWIHNAARNAVACFLTRGDLWIDWRLGRDLFEKYLIDSDTALNNGGWLWQSGSAYLPNHFTPQNPITYAKKFNPDDGAYVRRYIPALKNMPTQFIYEPWKASRHVQRKAGCIIGQDYPERIVIHEVESRVLTERMAAYHQKAKSSQSSSRSHGQNGQRRQLAHHVVSWKDTKRIENVQLNTS
ncbi:(6-4)DNA photolyase [Aphanomyces cochlioides]|nr:(6-4)DNA photolyase [Aphanomyces cochlioides]